MSELDGTELVDWRELPPGQRRGWWQQLWDRAIAVSDRYRLALRSGWWEDSLQAEALAAFCGWLRLYDTGAYTDPPGKLQLLWELEHLRAVLRAGDQAFDPERDRPDFDRHLDSIERPVRPLHTYPDRAMGDDLLSDNRQLGDELVAVTQRLGELREREAVLNADVHEPHGRRNRAFTQAEQDLAELATAIEQLARRERELRRQLDDRSG